MAASGRTFPGLVFGLLTIVSAAVPAYVAGSGFPIAFLLFLGVLLGVVVDTVVRSAGRRGWLWGTISCVCVIAASLGVAKWSSQVDREAFFRDNFGQPPPESLTGFEARQQAFDGTITVARFNVSGEGFASLLKGRAFERQELWEGAPFALWRGSMGQWMGIARWPHLFDAPAMVSPECYEWSDSSDAKINALHVWRDAADGRVWCVRLN